MVRSLPTILSVGAVIAIYAGLTLGRPSELAETARGAYYNLLVDGFRSGNLSLAREAPAGLAALANPYDPDANVAFRGEMYTGTDRIHDLSYFRGRLYLYFGVTPALVLFWPAAVGGIHVSHQAAVFIFATIAFLAGSALLLEVAALPYGRVSEWNRATRPRSQLLALPIAILAMGLAGGAPIAMSRPDVWEVPIFCGAALVMLSLYATWRAIQSAERRAAWIAAASLLYGLAVGARPSLLLGAPVVLLPAIVAWLHPSRSGVGSPLADSVGVRKRTPYEVRQAAVFLAAAILPMACVGIGLAAYNYARFGDILEFGQYYQLAGDSQRRATLGLSNLGTNIWTYLFSAPTWIPGFPYVAGAAPAAMPGSRGNVDFAYGVLVSTPFVLFVLGLVALWVRGQPSPGLRLAGMGQGVSARYFAIGTAVFVGLTALPVFLFYSACVRYQLDFTPGLLFLAALGFLALESSFPNWRAIIVGGGAVLMLFSAGFNVLTGLAWRSKIDADYGEALFYAQRYEAAARSLRNAVFIRPSAGGTWINLAIAECRAAHFPAARAAFERAIRANPAQAAEYRHFFGLELQRAGQPAQP